MREIMLGLAATGAVGGGVWYTGALEGGEFYPLPPAQVAHELAVMKLPDEVQQVLQDGELVRLKTQRFGTREVRWDVLLNEAPIARFTAELKPAEGGTRVKVDFALIDSEIGRTAAKETPLSTELVQTLAEIALAEQVDATLEDREFDDHRVANAAAGWIATHPGAAMGFGLKMQAMIESADPALQEDVREAFEANGDGRPFDPHSYFESSGSDAHDWAAERDQYEASAPMDSN